MLWYKSWLETRWRFAIGLALLLLSACSTVAMYPELVRLLPAIDSPVDVGSALGRRMQEALDLSRSYRGYVWSNTFRQNLPQLLAVFAAMLGAGGLLAQASGGGALFTLSLPATRDRLLAIRAATGLGELLVLAVLPALLVPLISPIVGETFSIVDALAYALCMFVAASVIYSLSFLLSTVFADVWRPTLIALGVGIAAAIAGLLLRDVVPGGIFGVMTGETYFRGEGLPWIGLAAHASASVVMVYAATRNFARLDF